MGSTAAFCWLQDPSEGEALAAALLQRLASTARLTYATTHHAGLKEMAATDPRFMNASVEFDIATLRPTYRWGQTPSWVQDRLNTCTL